MSVVVGILTSSLLDQFQPTFKSIISFRMESKLCQWLWELSLLPYWMNFNSIISLRMESDKIYNKVVGQCEEFLL
jgi:hypothetical protein